MSRNKLLLPMLAPGAAVFSSSACIMILELVAGRLTARYLGASIYTWTSVIGVVLTGIAAGNYLGGRMADRFPSAKTLAVLFTISSATCVLTVCLNNLVNTWTWLWRLSWPVHVFCHVSIIFLIPSALLGTIPPVVTRMALTRGLPSGRTVGNIYACSAAGSIAGTFLAGFYLIAAVGPLPIIWTIAGVLLLMALLCRRRLWIQYLWTAIFMALVSVAIVPTRWARNAAARLALRETPDPRIIYEDETPYCHIAVERVLKIPDKRVFVQDKFVHSVILMKDIDDLQYPYTRIYAGVTKGLTTNKKKLSVIVIGGGGYVYPRYIEKNWPGSRIDVVEIDPGVTKAAINAFGLDKNTSINTINMDARNYVDSLLEEPHHGQEIPQYDFIYEDALNDYSIPYQLITREFNDKIAQILKGDGIYMVTVIDVFDYGRFLASLYKTLQQTFPYVYVLSQSVRHDIRNAFVLVAAKQEVDIKTIITQHNEGLDIWYLDDSDINSLMSESDGLVLTDDYAPVESMLAPVVRRSAPDLLREKVLNQRALQTKVKRRRQ